MFKLKEALFPKLELPTPDSTSKILALDGLRGLAIASVLIYHCSSYFPIGWVGVDLFFVLSGFLLTGILIETKGSPIYFKSFFIKRALRILPLYYLLLTCAIIYSLTFGTPLPHYSYFFFFQNFLTTTLKSFPSGTNQLNHLWSVAVEEQFYLVLPLIVSLFQQKKLLIFLFTAVVVAIVVRAGLFLNNNIGYYVLLFSRMDALCLGSITAVMLRSNPMTLHKWAVPFLYASGA
ncbi:acyltransferase family protein [Pontibacter harenae]|uniref:acyltransferase family protein n=1 Tax=Pontibacter harenae TaxID=2894083 RepID=UPI001E2E32ED|nr:acyltransferase [Pontibacter harenae]MCC9166046.1 acyltransferase [Pontibacter harenae]